MSSFGNRVNAVLELTSGVDYKLWLDAVGVVEEAVLVLRELLDEDLSQVVNMLEGGLDDEPDHEETLFTKLDRAWGGLEERLV